MGTTKVTVPIAPLGKAFHGMPAPYAAEPARHTVTVQIPGWNMLIEFTKKDPAFFAKFVDFYPRFVPHRDIKKLVGTILDYTKAQGMFGLPFPSLKAAEGCVGFVTANPRTDNVDSVPKEEVSIRAFEMSGIKFYLVMFPMPQMPLVAPWWQNTGTGISSRLAEDALRDPSSLKEVDINTPRQTYDLAPNKAVCKRVAELLEREPIVGPAREVKIQADDVYLYPSGMTAICALHDNLLEWKENKAKTVLFGLAFHQTIHIFEFWGPGVKQFPLGTELEALEKYLQEEQDRGTPVQAIWTEFPSNPLLVSADLWKLRELSDKFKCVFVVDETVGSFCNVDVVPVADVIVTSLTKSFNGYADVIAGSVALNPNSSYYPKLKALFDKNFGNDFYPRDAEVLLVNSEDYFARSRTLNDNAAVLVEYLQEESQDPTSPVAKVYYPTVSPTLANYDAFKRPSSADFTPGYGCLFSVELDTEQTTIAFYENLEVHQGPHLGAHRTLCMPYVMGLYTHELDKVAAYDMRPTQLRISAGLEPEDELLQIFKHAVKKARELKPLAEEAGGLRMVAPPN